MKFIIPKNYKFNPKLFGIIDYQTAVLDGIYALLLYIILNIIFSSITIKIYCFIGFFMPFAIFSIVGVNHENIISVFIYMFKFYTNQKVYLYNKKRY